MAPDNTALHGTAFTVSIDAEGPRRHHRHFGPRSGANDPGRRRCRQLSGRLRPAGTRLPAARPPGGVLERRGQTEAAVDLASLAGLYPAGVICEIVNDDGTMARVPDLIRFCKTHGLVMVTVADLARYRLESEYDESLWAIDGSLLCV